MSDLSGAEQVTIDCEGHPFKGMQFLASFLESLSRIGPHATEDGIISAMEGSSSTEPLPAANPEA